MRIARPRITILRLALGLLAGAGVCGCAGTVASDPLPLQSVPAFSTTGTEPLVDRWWLVLNDAGLNERIDRALAGNFTLAVAWERLNEARAIVRRESAALAPQLDGLAGVTVQSGDGVDDGTRLSLGVEASYEIDLWGRIRSLVDAERFSAAASAEDYAASAITLSAEVALAWYRLAEASRQLELIDSQIATNRKVLEVLENRFAVGQSDSADVLRQRQLVEATQEQRIVVLGLIETLEHQLAVLEGRPPQEMAGGSEMPALPEIPPLPQTGLPAELLERRPDVRSAFLLLRASDATVGAAVRDQYPRIDLGAALTTSAEDPSGLFSNWIASLAGQLTAPLLDGGERRAEVDRTVALRRQRLAEYGQTVLEAFREVEDALATEASRSRRIESIRKQLDLSRTTYTQLRTQYLNGAADFIDVLTALREQQELERELLASELNRIESRILLYRALAGGFRTPREEQTPSDDSVSASAPPEEDDRGRIG